MPKEYESKLATISKQLKKGIKPKPVTARAFINWLAAICMAVLLISCTPSFTPTDNTSSTAHDYFVADNTSSTIKASDNESRALDNAASDNVIFETTARWGDTGIREKVQFRELHDQDSYYVGYLQSEEAIEFYKSKYSASYVGDKTYLIGSNNEPLVIKDRQWAKNTTFENILIFIGADDTDSIPYNEGEFMCAEYAQRVHNNAELCGIKCELIIVILSEADDSNNLTFHCCNKFKPIDYEDFVVIDCTPSCCEGIDVVGTRSSLEKLIAKGLISNIDYYSLSANDNYYFRIGTDNHIYLLGNFVAMLPTIKLRSAQDFYLFEKQQMLYQTK